MVVTKVQRGVQVFDGKAEGLRKLGEAFTSDALSRNLANWLSNSFSHGTRLKTHFCASQTGRDQGNGGHAESIRAGSSSVWAARERYMAACRLAEAETELYHALQAVDGIDHRPLHSAHDQIAAWYRFHHDDGGQLRIGEDEDRFVQRLADEWRTFFCREVDRLVKGDEFTRTVLTAVAFANSERGSNAEQELGALLREKYWELQQARSANAVGALSK